MKLKNIIELLTLSTSLYTISKDKELMQQLEDFATKGKTNLTRLIKENSKNEYDEYENEFIENLDDGQPLIAKLLEKANDAKVDLELKIEEIAVKMYEKMHIAHTDEIKKLNEEIINIKTELALAEARIVQLEQ